MPNWCSNTVKIVADDSEKLKRLQEAVQEGKDLFNQFVPQPKFEDDQAWYFWNIENWGTKWDASPMQVIWDNNQVAFSMETAWSPPIAFYEALEEQGYQVEAYYLEEGMCFVGRYNDGDDEYYEYNDMSSDDMRDSLPEWVDEQWGIIERRQEEEDEENREPTEWEIFNTRVQKMERTDWYTFKVKPVRDGRYEIKTKEWPWPHWSKFENGKWEEDGWLDDDEITHWRGTTEESLREFENE